jgi:hypothetical protein
MFCKLFANYLSVTWTMYHIFILIFIFIIIIIIIIIINAMHDSLLNPRWIRNSWTRSHMLRRFSSRSIMCSNLASDEDSVLVRKLIIELYTSIMSTSEWWLSNVTSEQRTHRNNEHIGTTNTSEQRTYQNIGTINIAEQRNNCT